MRDDLALFNLWYNQLMAGEVLCPFAKARSEVCHQRTVVTVQAAP